jgi:hypothetical protein
MTEISQTMKNYLRLVAGELMDLDWTLEAKDAEWDKMSKAEQDTVNAIVEAVFGDYL